MAGAPLQQTELERLNDELGVAFTQGGVARVAALYTHDAMLLPPGSPRLHDRQGIEAWWCVVREHFTAIAHQTQAVGESGDLADEVGTATIRGQEADGTPNAHTAHLCDRLETGS